MDHYRLASTSDDVRATETATVMEVVRTRGGPVRRHAQATGFLLTLLGILGLVPGITTHDDQMGFFRSGAQLFGVFTVPVVSSALLFLYGVTVLAFAGSVRQAHENVVLHALVLTVVGFAGIGVVVNSPDPVLSTDAATNCLYLSLGAFFLVGGYVSGRQEIRHHGVF